MAQSVNHKHKYQKMEKMMIIAIEGKAERELRENGQ